jgi:hypothetical protein
MVYLRENASETAWKKRGTIAAMIFFPALAAHMLLARSGFFLNYYYQIRYDAYLAALVLLVLLLVAHEARPAIRSWRWPAKAALVLLVLLVSQPVLERGVRASAKVAAATRTTHTYQVQMGRFLNRYFTGKTVVLNDIGAANFFADIRCLDILALCSRDVAKVILNDRYTSEVIAQLAVEAGAEIAVVNDDFLHGAGGIPAGWIPVGRWFITNNVISRENVLSFYVLDESNRAALTAALKDYAPEIPGEVRQVLENTR